MTVEEFYEKRYGKKPPVIFGVYEVSFTPKEACRFAEAYHKAKLEKVSDEDIRQEAFRYDDNLEHDYYSPAEYFREGAKWMLKHLNNK